MKANSRQTVYTIDGQPHIYDGAKFVKVDVGQSPLIANIQEENKSTCIEKIKLQTSSKEKSMFGGLFRKKIDKEDLVKASLISAVELYKVQTKSGGILSEPKTIESTVLAISKNNFQIDLTESLLEICKTLTMMLLMDEVLIKDIVRREKENQFEGLTSSDSKYLQSLIEKYLPEFL